MEYTVKKEDPTKEKMEPVFDRENMMNNRGGKDCDDQNSGASFLGGFLIFIIVLALLWWFKCNLGVAFVIALILGIIAGCLMYAWEDNDDCDDNHGKKKKKNCNSSWAGFLYILGMVIIWIIIFFIIYSIVRKALVDEKCNPTECCKPQCEDKCPPVADCDKKC